MILLRCGRRGPPLRRRPSPPIPGRQIERKSPFFFPRPESRAIGGGGRGKGRISATPPPPPPPPPSGREEDDGKKKKKKTTVFPSCYPAPFLLPFRASRERERSREASHASCLPSFNPTEVRYSYKPLYRIYTFGRGCTPRSTVAPIFPELLLLLLETPFWCCIWCLFMFGLTSTFLCTSIPLQAEAGSLREAKMGAVKKPAASLMGIISEILRLFYGLFVYRYKIQLGRTAIIHKARYTRAGMDGSPIPKTDNQYIFRSHTA